MCEDGPDNDDEETDEEVTDDEGSGVESEGGMFRSPRPTRSGFTYLSPQSLTPLTPSSPPQPPPEDLDTVSVCSPPLF